MTNNKKEERCTYPGCDCAVSEDELYCSSYCQTAPESEVHCGCGHPACSAGKVGSAAARFHSIQNEEK
jgi:hypothetical protein